MAPARPLAALLIALLPAAGLLPVPSRAAPPAGTTVLDPVQVQAFVAHVQPAGDSCTVTDAVSGTDTDQSTGPSVDVVATDTGEAQSPLPGDDVVLEGTARATVGSTLVGEVRTLTVRAALDVAALPRTGASACQVAVAGQVATTTTLELAVAGWVTLTATADGPAGVGIQVDGDAHDVVLTLTSSASESRVRAFLEAGQYLVRTQASARSPEASGGGGRVASTVTTTVRVVPPGRALAAAGGTKRIATLPAALDCDRSSAVVRLGRGVAGARTVALRAGGRTVRTVRGPKPGAVVTLRTLPVRAPLTLSVTARGRTTSRSYEACPPA